MKGTVVPEGKKQKLNNKLHAQGSTVVLELVLRRENAFRHLVVLAWTLPKALELVTNVLTRKRSAVKLQTSFFNLTVDFYPRPDVFVPPRAPLTPEVDVLLASAPGYVDIARLRRHANRVISS